jgi:hypothetical protein
MIKLRPYQEKLAIEAVDILNRKKIVYLAMEVRTGKTATSLQTSFLGGFKNVLFITKKKAISSIENDFVNFDFNTKFNLTIINNESLHLVEGKFDLLISDEHHRNGAFPKPNTVTKLIKQKYGHLPMIFLSGTPTPESYSQWFHQFWVSNYSPFKDYINFYKWAADFVNVKQRKFAHGTVNDYSDCNYLKFKRALSYYTISFTQKEAGFTTYVNENVLEVEMKPITYQVIERLKKDLIVKNNLNQVILADTGVKLMQKLHQLYSGTCKFEDGTSKVIDYSKAEFIYDTFKDYKIAIFYKFTEEYNALKTFLGDKITNDLEEFNASDKWIALQVVAGREGISLKKADHLVYYNIDFSAVSYWQSRDRMTTIDRLENTVFYIFSKNGIELKIYKSVLAKKDYTLSMFNKDYDRAKNTKENIGQVDVGRVVRG